MCIERERKNTYAGAQRRRCYVCVFVMIHTEKGEQRQLDDWSARVCANPVEWGGECAVDDGASLLYYRRAAYIQRIRTRINHRRERVVGWGGMILGGVELLAIRLPH